MTDAVRAATLMFAAAVALAAATPTAAQTPPSLTAPPQTASPPTAPPPTPFTLRPLPSATGLRPSPRPSARPSARPTHGGHPYPSNRPSHGQYNQSRNGYPYYQPSVNIDSQTVRQLLATPHPTPSPRPTPKPNGEVFDTMSTGGQH